MVFLRMIGYHSDGGVAVRAGHHVYALMEHLGWLPLCASLGIYNNHRILMYCPRLGSSAENVFDDD